MRESDGCMDDWRSQRQNGKLRWNVGWTCMVLHFAGSMRRFRHGQKAMTDAKYREFWWCGYEIKGAAARGEATLRLWSAGRPKVTKSCGRYCSGGDST